MSIKYFAFAFAIVGIFVAALVVASGDPATGRAQEAEASSPTPQLYWVDGVTGKIQRTNRDEHTVVEDVVASGLVSPRSIALDVAVGKMYWTDSGERKIQRANLDGSGVEDLVTSEFGLLNPVSIALDLSARRMYWGRPRERQDPARQPGRLRRRHPGRASACPVPDRVGRGGWQDVLDGAPHRQDTLCQPRRLRTARTAPAGGWHLSAMACMSPSPYLQGRE